jgi:hypothetical protein
LKGLKQNAVRLCLKRETRHGRRMDKSETPLYRSHIELMVRAYFKSDPSLSRDAAQRALTILCLWLGAGRSSEVAYLHLDGMRWDTLANCLFAEWTQPKTSKVKIVAFPAGCNRHLQQLLLHAVCMHVFMCLCSIRVVCWLKSILYTYTYIQYCVCEFSCMNMYYVSMHEYVHVLGSCTDLAQKIVLLYVHLLGSWDDMNKHFPAHIS